MKEFDHDFGILPRLLTKLGLRSSRNLQVYGTTEPPVFDPKNIKVDVKLYYSIGDPYVPEKASSTLERRWNAQASEK